jgi:hypothetical protein
MSYNNQHYPLSSILNLAIIHQMVVNKVVVCQDVRTL